MNKLKSASIQLREDILIRKEHTPTGLQTTSFLRLSRHGVLNPNEFLVSDHNLLSRLGSETSSYENLTKAATKSAPQVRDSDVASFLQLHCQQKLMRPERFVCCGDLYTERLGVRETVFGRTRWALRCAIVIT